MATHEAGRPAETEEGCPVCLTPLADEPVCAHCRWVLDGPPVLGPLTARIRHAFDERLAAARRRLDLRAAARVAGYPGHGVPERLPRLERLARGGPPHPGEREDVLAELERAGPLPAAEPGPVPDGVVVEITARGLRTAVFRQGIEETGATEWRWADLLPEPPREENELLFLLAGGIGARTTVLPTAPEPADLGAATTATALVSRLTGWPVPERLLARLKQRLPDARVLYLPASEAQPGPLRHPPGFTTVVCGTGPEHDGVRLAGGSPDGSVTVWRLWRTEPIATRVLHDRIVTCVDLAEDGLSLATGGQDGAVRLWSYGASGRVRVLTWHDGWVNALRLRGGAVFSLGDDGQVYRSVLGDAGIGGAPLARVGWASATALDVTSDGRTVVVGGPDGASLWDGSSGERVGRLGENHAVTALALAPAGRLLALGCADGVVRVHGLRGDRARVAELGGHTGAVRRIAFDPGGALATADDSGTIRLRTDHGKDAVALGAHPGRVRGLAFTPDGHLLSAGGDGLVRTWPIPHTD